MSNVDFKTQLNYHSKVREKGIHFQAKTRSQALVEELTKKSLRKVVIEPRREMIQPGKVSKDMGKFGVGHLE